MGKALLIEAYNQKQIGNFYDMSNSNGMNVKYVSTEV
jgi:hypothetical protein